MQCIYVIHDLDYALAFNIQHALSSKMIVKLESMPSTLTFFWGREKMAEMKCKNEKEKLQFTYLFLR